MKRQKPKTFDFPTPADQAPIPVEAVADEIDVLAPAIEMDAEEPLSQIVANQDISLETRDEPVELPRLSPPSDGYAIGDALAMRASTAPSGLPYYLIALFVSCLVMLGPVLFAWSYQRDVVPFRNGVFALGVVALLAIGPAALVWLTAFVLHRMARLADDARRAEALTDQLTQPTSLAVRGAGSAIESVRHEIENATTAAAKARIELLSLREVLAVESQRLIEATEGSSRTATALIRDLASEREKMNLLAATLDAQAAGVGDAITRHARMVAEASDLAETQLREAEAALTARAADLAAAAGEASDAARVASEDLSRQVGRLETAGQGVGEQVRLVEEGLTEQRAALVSAADGIRADQEVFAAEAESQLARLSEVLVYTREGASELGDVATRGADVLNQLLTSASGQLADIVEATTYERDLLSAATAQSLGAISEIASRERQALEEQAQQSVDNMLVVTDDARRQIESHLMAVGRERDLLSAAAAQSLNTVGELAARERDQIELQTQITIENLTAAADQAHTAVEAHATTARQKVDQLSEAAFAAGQRAEAVFENRLSEARNLIEQSVHLVDEAGAASVARLGEGVHSARSTLAEFEGLLTDIDTRIARLPADAQARAEAVRATIERGMEELMASARRAAEETQSIDAAFQDRVRRNYDMLSEAVRLMGVVAGAAGGPAGRALAAPTPQTASSSPSRPAPPPLVDTRPAPARPERTEEARPELRSPAAAGLRPRLRLTPTASDEEFSTVFEAAGGREGPRREPGPRETAEPGGDGWTWKELLSSMDDEPAVNEFNLAEVVLGEMETMGIDASALLSRSRIEEIALAVVSGEAEDIRKVVRRLAPAAIRRLSRRMTADRMFRAQSDHFVRRYHDLITDAARRGDDKVVISALLGSDQGRAYLLYDAAVSEGL